MTDDQLAALRDLHNLTPTIRNDMLKGWRNEGLGAEKFYVTREAARRYADALLAWAETPEGDDTLSGRSVLHARDL